MVDGAQIKETTFKDWETGREIQVSLSVRDIIYFRLLEQIARGLNR